MVGLELVLAGGGLGAGGEDGGDPKGWAGVWVPADGAWQRVTFPAAWQASLASPRTPSQAAMELQARRDASATATATAPQQAGAMPSRSLPPMPVPLTGTALASRSHQLPGGSSSSGSCSSIEPAAQPAGLAEVAAGALRRRGWRQARRHLPLGRGACHRQLAVHPGLILTPRLLPTTPLLLLLHQHRTLRKGGCRLWIRLAMPG